MKNFRWILFIVLFVGLFCLAESSTRVWALACGKSVGALASPGSSSGEKMTGASVRQVILVVKERGARAAGDSASKAGEAAVRIPNWAHDNLKARLRSLGFVPPKERGNLKVNPPYPRGYEGFPEDVGRSQTKGAPNGEASAKSLVNSGFFQSRIKILSEWNSSGEFGGFQLEVEESQRVSKKGRSH